MATHYNRKTGEIWAYCERCQALGALNPDGVMYGKATREQCTGTSSRPVRHAMLQPT